MRIAIVGSGYVGLVTGTCFAEVGIDTVCIDIDKAKIEKMKQGIAPIYEPGLEPIMIRNIAKNRLRFTTNFDEVIDDVDVVFSAVGTPPDEDGSADLKYVLDVAKSIGQRMTKHVLVVTKSTVPVGTAKKVRDAIQTELDKRGVKIEFDVASNPEFLKEGDAINDFLKPDRIVVGVETERAKEIMEKLYRPFTLNGHPIIFMDVPSAEMTKYAANAMLATRISFMNDIANLCEVVGANVNMIRKGIGSDPRIGSKFLYSGVGYGGSCFPKDVKALIKTADELGHSLRILKAVEEVNDTQKTVLFKKLNEHYKSDLKNKKVAIWGLSFKPNTDDMREAPAISLIEKLLDAGCRVCAYDPVAMSEAKRKIGNVIEYANNPYEALDDAHALMLVTEWAEFKNPDWNLIKNKMKDLLILDGRNIYERKDLNDNGFLYANIGSNIG